MSHSVLQYPLSNGREVILAPIADSPMLRMQLLVKTGSIHEKKGEQGISHFIEHMFFKGSKNVPEVGAVATQIESMGGSLNAYTTFDHTVYYFNLPKEHLKAGLALLSDMMSFPLFRNKDIEDEKEVVIEELKQGEDSEPRMSIRSLFSGVYEGTAYAHPVIGYEDQIRAYTAQQVRDYFKLRYQPKNSFLTLSGGFDEEEAKELIQTHFGLEGDFGKLEESSPITIDMLEKKITVKEHNFQKSSAYVSWKLPQVNDSDILGLEFLAFVLGQGASSRLYKKIKLEKSLVQSLSASVYTSRSDGFFAISFKGQDLDYSLVYDEIICELKKLKTEGLHEDEFQKALMQFSLGQVQSLETAGGYAESLSSSYFYHDDPLAFEKQLEELKTLTPKGLIEIFEKWILNQNCTLNINSKEIKSIDNKTLLQKWDSLKNANPSSPHESIQLNPISISLSKSSEKPELIQLTDAVQLILYPTLNTPYVHGSLAFLGGSKKLKKAQGLETLLSRSWPRSYKSMSENEFNELKERKGFHLSSFTGRHSMGLSFNFLPSQKKVFLDCFQKALEDFHVTAEVLDREKQMIEQQRKGRLDQPLQMGYLKLLELLFKDHYYGQDPLGAEDSLGQLTSSDLQSFVESHYDQGPKVICLSGNIQNKTALVRDFEQQLGQFKNNKSVAFETYKISDNVRFSQETGKEQSHLLQAYPSLKMNDELMPVLDVIEGLLSGQGGRLFLNLRDNKSLAYSVAPLRLEGLEAGIFMTYMSCSPEKKQDALLGMAEEIQKLTQETIKEDELQRTKNYIIGNFVSQLQRSSFRNQSACFDTLYGNSPLDHLAWAEKVRAVTSEDILKLSQRLFQKQIAEVIYG